MLSQCFSHKVQHQLEQRGVKKMVAGQKPPRQKPPGQKPPNNKPPRNNEEIIAKYTVDANLFRLGSTIPKIIYPLDVFFGGGEAPHQKTIKESKKIICSKKISIKKNSNFFFQKCSNSHERCGMC